MLSQLEEALLKHTEKLRKITERLLQQSRADGQWLRDLHELVERIGADPAFGQLDRQLQQATRTARDGLASYLGDSAALRVGAAEPPKRYDV
jgi:hypothetical protein